MSELALELKTAMSELKTAIANAAPKSVVDAIQKQVDALDVKLAGRIVGDAQEPAFVETLKSNESFQRLLHNRRGEAIITLTGKDAAALLERKTTITSSGAGYQTTGVLPIDRISGITPEARQQLTVRDALTARPTTMAVVDFVKVTTPMGVASPQVEASTKAENAVTFTSVSEKVRTIATWIPATKQILDDFTELASFLQDSLSFYVNLEEELQLLSGDNTGENLHGLITQATAFSTSLLSNASGWNKIDIVGRAIQQITAAKELAPTFVIMHPNDWFGIRLTKDSYGRYLVGDPQTSVNARLFDLQVIPTTSIASGTFLVGSGNPAAAEIRDRMELQFAVSTEHQDFFVKNLVAVRAEKRMALVVKRASSFITGTFNTSPAGGN